MIKITTLIDNKPGANRSMACVHGLSFYVETDETTILFDFGPGAEFLENMDRLGISPETVRYAVCSHSHYDHAGGYKYLLKAGVSCPFITGKNFFEEKYAFEENHIFKEKAAFGGRNTLESLSESAAIPGKYSYLGCGFHESDLAANHVPHLVCQDIQKIAPGCYAAGNFLRKYGFETIPARFVKQRGNSMIPDTFEDEIALVLDHPQGLIVLVGCSHPGILNVLFSIKERFQKPLQAVIGGVHLNSCSDSRLGQTMAWLKIQGLNLLALNHCSGEKAVQRLEKDGGIPWAYLGSGETVMF